VEKNQQQEPKSLSDEVRAIWEQNAAFWDEKMGEGNQFQRVLIAPEVEKMLQITAGQTVLDAACGNGVFARRMAQLGARVVAVDFSRNFLERAAERSQEYAHPIEYQVVDVTNREELLALGRRRFDSIYCGMALQDMTEIDPLFSAAAELLQPGGVFVFSVPHPAFNSNYTRFLMEEEDRQGELVVQYALKMTGYIQPLTERGTGIIGQPEAHYYFHRPISDLYNTAFQHGFVLDAVAEPVFPPGEMGERSFSWANFRDFPPVLISRVRTRLDR
jgi:2-polyprenyl-3-methyl-5-hydroxy-6-metoxy-1,4-benzoquinol methylase